MAIEHNGKILRSLPEQVAKNLTDIIKLMADITALTNLVNSKLTGAMHYKGSVATVADLPSTGNEIGDFYNVTDTGANYAWDGTQWDDIGSIVDLAPYARKDQDNTFSAKNEFVGDVKVDNVLDLKDGVIIGVNDIDNKIAVTDYTIAPTISGQKDIGTVNRVYRTAYASGISNGVVTFTINDFQSMDQDISEIMHDYVTSQDLANYATKDEAFNVINASDISNPLTAEQVAIFKNGKPTRIKGSFLGLIDAIYYPASYKASGQPDNGMVVGQDNSGEYAWYNVRGYSINNTNKLLIYSATGLRLSYRGNRTEISEINGILLLKGKTFPNYPATYTGKQYKLGFDYGQNYLSWIEDLTSSEIGDLRNLITYAKAQGWIS